MASHPPSIDAIAAAIDDGTLPRALLVEIARRTVADRHDGADLEGRARSTAAAMTLQRRTRVINATGVLLHTNLGRAPLHPEAVAAAAEAATGYSPSKWISKPAPGAVGEVRQCPRHGSDRSGSRADRRQQRRSAAVGDRRIGRRKGRGRFSRRTDRDRRLVPASRDHRRRRCPHRRGGHHEPHPTEGLPAPSVPTPDWFSRCIRRTTAWKASPKRFGIATSPRSAPGRACPSSQTSGAASSTNGCPGWRALPRLARR